MTLAWRVALVLAGVLCASACSDEEGLTYRCEAEFEASRPLEGTELAVSLWRYGCGATAPDTYRYQLDGKGDDQHYDEDRVMLIARHRLEDADFRVREATIVIRQVGNDDLYSSADTIRLDRRDYAVQLPDRGHAEPH